MISVIMPLYNAEKYLHEAIDTVLHQLCSDFELICVDDCSSDGTAGILREYEKDPRVKLLRNEQRMGAAYSRNTGIHEAKGDYLAFLDGDDYFMPEMLESAYTCAKKNELDVVVYEYKITTSENIGKDREKIRTKQFYEKYATTPFKMTDISACDFALLNNAPWNKLYRKDFIIGSGIQFQDLPSQNDVYFSNMVYLKAQRLMFLRDNRIMLYARDHGAQSRITNNKNPINVYLAYRKTLLDLSNEERYDLYPYAHLKLYYILLNRFKIQEGEAIRRYLMSEAMEELRSFDLILDEKCASDYQPHLLELLEKEPEVLKKESILSISFRRPDNKLMNAIRSCNNCIVYGAGSYGRALLNLIDGDDKEKVTVVDKNAAKLGSIGDFRVSSPDLELIDSADLIILAIINFDREVYDQLSGAVGKVMYILDYL